MTSLLAFDKLVLALMNSVASKMQDSARVAQLVEHDLAKVGAAGSSPVSRSNNKKEISVWISLQTVDKVHGICRGFFFIKVSKTQYLSGLEALFLI